MFNALKYTEELEKAGFTESQAKASLKLIIEVMNESFSTKSDLNATKLELKADLVQLRSELSADIISVRNELSAEIKSVRNELGAEIKNLRNEVFAEINNVRNELTSEIKRVEWELGSKIQSLDSNVKQLENRLTIKLGGMMVVTVGLAVTLMKLI